MPQPPLPSRGTPEGRTYVVLRWDAWSAWCGRSLRWREVAPLGTVVARSPAAARREALARWPAARAELRVTPAGALRWRHADRLGRALALDGWTLLAQSARDDSGR